MKKIFFLFLISFIKTTFCMKMEGLATENKEMEQLVKEIKACRIKINVNSDVIDFLKRNAPLGYQLAEAGIFSEKLLYYAVYEPQYIATLSDESEWNPFKMDMDDDASSSAISAIKVKIGTINDFREATRALLINLNSKNKKS